MGLQDSHHPSEDHHTAVCKAQTSIHSPQLTELVERTQYLGVILNTQLTLSNHMNQVGKKGTPKTWHTRPSCNLSTTHSVMLHKHILHPMMDYACPIWRSAACTHVRKMHA